MDWAQYALHLGIERAKLGLAIFDPKLHPRGLWGRFIDTTGTDLPDWAHPVPRHIVGSHGVTGEPIKGEFQGRTTAIYIGDEKLAGTYGEASGVVHTVEYDAKAALVLDEGRKIKEAWLEPGIWREGPNGEPRYVNQGEMFHGYGSTTYQFEEWARWMGYDAVVIDWPHIGDYSPVGPDEELTYEWGSGIWGEPQTLLLYPDRAKIT